jgi:hypothetical protein
MTKIPKDLGIKVAKNPEHAAWVLSRDTAKRRLMESKIAIILEVEVLKKCEDMVKTFENEEEVKP